jgi:hypothetical protein
MKNIIKKNIFETYPFQHIEQTVENTLKGQNERVFRV